MNIDELEQGLPNGLHDSLLRTYSSDGGGQRAEFILDVWIGDLHSPEAAARELRRPARLELLGLGYLVVDGHPRFPVAESSPLQISACRADDNPALAGRVPPGGFAGRFFVTEWNASIHFAAMEARLVWLGAN